MQMASRRTVFSLWHKYTLQTQKHTHASFQCNFTSVGDCGHLRSYGTAQKDLLHYPVLPLDQTIERFMKSAEPFLSKEELAEDRKQAKVFLKCEGPKLQKFLEDEAKKNDNWLVDRWKYTMYLKSRHPLTIFSSPVMTLPRITFKDDDEYLRHSAKLMFCLLKYKQFVDKGKIPILKIGVNELDNSLFGKVIGTCRIPHKRVDTIEYNPRSTHAVVIYKNHFYKLRLYSKALNPLHPNSIYEELKKIHAAEKKDGTPFGILTSDKRKNWAAAYKQLLAIDGNGASIHEIQKSLFTISLDGELCQNSGGNQNSILAEVLTHGCGSHMYAGNRWYDKTVQLIVNRSGFQGFCYEHSPADAQPLMVDYIIKNLDDEALREGTDCEVSEPAKKLPLKSSKVLDKYIKTAKKNIDNLAEDLHIHVMHFKEFGREELKDRKISPDSFIQMALQYAFYKMYKEPGACYESAHLRIFRSGRTETIRSCTNESMAFVKAMYEPYSDEERVRLLRMACSTHAQNTAMAVQGRGVDRHLFGLKLMAIENRIPIPDFYSQRAFKRSTNFRLSTSQVGTLSDSFMCFGPMFHNGYGCCYNPRDHDIYFSVTAWRSCDDTCADRFAKAVQTSLTEMMGALHRVKVKRDKMKEAIKAKIKPKPKKK